MSMYDRDDPRHESYRHRHNETQRAVAREFDAADKARDPLAFYWKKGCQHLRDTFNLEILFHPKPEETYDERKYND